MRSTQERPWEKYHIHTLNELGPAEISIYGLLHDSAKRNGTRTAVTFQGEELTYEQLKSRTDRVAGCWREMGFEKGERIGLMIRNHPDYMVAYYAAHALGLVVVQINPNYTVRELVQILTDAGVSYMVVDGVSINTVEKVENMYPFKAIITSQTTVTKKKASIFHMEDLMVSDTVLDTPAVVDTENDVAVIQYTGGTTGKIKGAMLTHKNLIANVMQSYVMYKERISLDQERVLAATPLYHVYAMTSAMNLGIYMGANILLIAKFQIDEVMQIIKKYQPTFFPGVPKMYISFVNYPNAKDYGLDCFQVCSCGSAPLPVEVIKRFESVSGTKILEGFGMSETSPTTHRTPINGETKIGSVGIPVPETDSIIIDDDHNKLGLNTVGELLVKGPQIMKGYWENETETNSVLKNGWMHTGDLAMQDEDGYFYIVGRKKEMIIIGGFNIYPPEIESVLYEYPSLEEAAVVGIPDSEEGETVKAYIVPKDGCTIEVEELKAHCYQNLTPYKVPKQFEIMDELPRNTVGKLLKRKLVEKEKE